MKLADYFNTIINSSTVGGLNQERINGPYKSFGLGVDGIYFIGDNFFDYELSLKALYQNDKSIHETYTVQEFERKLIEFLRPNFPEKLQLEEKKCRSFLEELNAISIADYSVFREIHGINLKNLQQPYELGPFTIYHFASHRRLIEAKTAVSPELIWEKRTPIYLIEVAVKARHSEKAEEIADLLFEKFELCLGFAIGSNRDRYEVGILNYRGSRHQKAYIFSADVTSHSHKNQGAFKNIPIDDKYFTESGFDRMWHILKMNNPSELQKRLLLAIEWAGQSYNELSLPSGFLKAAIALEILFTHNEKTLINASILSQISEGIALILGNNADDRLRIEKELKRLYSMRSAIAHAGKGDVSEEDLFLIFSYCRNAILTIMTTPSLRDLQSISDIHAHLKKLKYSCAAI